MPVTTEEVCDCIRDLHDESLAAVIDEVEGDAAHNILKHITSTNDDIVTMELVNRIRVVVFREAALRFRTRYSNN